jgi:MFS family permease
MAEPLTTLSEELRVEEPLAAPRERPSELLGRRGFRRVYAAVVASELGDAFQYVALMWFALRAGGPLGVLAVRLADSVPALVFGFHGGALADRLDRRRVMVAADLVRGCVLVPVAIAGLTGNLPLWGLVLAAFALTTGASYFDPAYGALLPALVDRRNVQQANALVRASTEAVTVAGWAGAAGLLAVLPLSGFFALNAASFFVSAGLLFSIRVAGPGPVTGPAAAPQLRAGIAALRPLPALGVAVLVLGVAVTISSGTWIVGVPQLVRHTLGHGAGAFSLVASGYAVGSILGAAALSRRPVRRKALASLLAWTLYLPAYGTFALAHSLGAAIAGAAGCGLGQGSAWVLLNSAAQEQVPDGVLGRVMGLIALVHRGAHATGLVFVAPLFAVVGTQVVFGGAAIAIAAVGLAGAAAAVVLARRQAAFAAGA